MLKKRAAKSELDTLEKSFAAGHFDAVVSTVDHRMTAWDKYPNETGIRARALRAHALAQLNRWTESLGEWNTILAKRYNLTTDDEYNVKLGKVKCLRMLKQWDAAERIHEELIRPQADPKKRLSAPMLACAQLGLAICLASNNNKDPNRQRKLLESAVAHLEHPEDVTYAIERITQLGPAPPAKRPASPSDGVQDSAKTARKVMDNASETVDKAIADLKQTTNLILGHIKTLKPQCVVCMNAMRSVRFNCAHTVCCQTCADTIIASSNASCPICRQTITSSLSVIL
jgi:hypothetical protein